MNIRKKLKEFRSLHKSMDKEFKGDFQIPMKLFGQHNRWRLRIFALLVLLMTAFVFFSQIMFLSGLVLSFNSVRGAIVYAKLVCIFYFFRWLMGICTIILIIILPRATFYSLLLANVVASIYYRLFARESSFYNLCRSKYSRFWWKKYGEYLAIFLAFCGMVIFYLMIILTQRDIPFEHLADLFIRVVALMVTVAFAVKWTYYLNLRKRRKKTSLFDRYLFSKQTMRRSLKNIVTFIMWTGGVGMILLPVFFAVLESLAETGAEQMLNKFQYRQLWEFIIQDGYSPKSVDTSIVAALPNPDELAKSLSWFPSLPGEFQRFFPVFQQRLFYITVLFSIFQVGIPSVVSVIIFANRRKAMLSLVLATVKSSFFVFLLKALIETFFFIEFPESLVISVFFFVITFFLMQQSIHTEFSPERTMTER